MVSFNANSFIKTLKEGYEAIPYRKGSKEAKIMVANSISSKGYNPEEALSFIYNQMGLPTTLDETGWKKVVETAIKRGDSLSKNLQVYKSTLKNKLSYEEMFKTAVMCCEKNLEGLKYELCLNNFGWDKAMEKLCGKKDESKEVESKVVKPKVVEPKEKKTVKKAVTKGKKKSSIKSSKKYSCIPVVGYKDGKRKEWSSFRDCEKELYEDPKKGHGAVSQCFSGKLKTVKGWKLYKKGEEPKETVEKVARKKAVLQIKVDKKGREKVVKTYSSISEAAKVTGIGYPSISKATTGTYQTAGGFKWKTASAA